eukprot:s2722_g13.t1
MGTRYDPKTNKVSYIPLGVDTNEFRIAALDTGTVRHGLEKTTYAVRVKECREFLALLQKNGYKIQSLGDVKDRKTYDEIIAKYGKSHPNLCERLEYLFFAQERFEAMVKAWREGNIAEVGAIFRRDGIGLRDEYQISGPELETMVNIARTIPGVLGERMLGGGDKGASGAILRPDAEQSLRNAESTAWQLFSPREFPALSDEEKQEGQAAFPSITVQHRSLDAPEPIRLKPRRMPMASTSCWSFAALAGLCGLAKVGAGACAAGCVAGVAQLGHSVVRTVIDSIGHGNARRWQSAVVAPQPAQTPSAASSGGGLSTSDSGTQPKESPKETPTGKGSDDTAECTGTTLAGHGVVLELPSEAVERLSPYLCDYLLRAVTSNQKSSWWRALRRLLGRRWLLSAVHSAIKDPLPLVLALDLDPWEVELDGYSFNLQMPSMRFAVVLQVEVSSIGCSFVRAFAAFPDELVENLIRCLQEQMQGWDLREMDPRFAGFTQPARVAFDLEVDWPSSSEIRFMAKKLNSRLDLSAS